MPTPDEIYSFFEYDPIATRAIQQFYTPFFTGKKRVLDIACGRGEFLKLLRDNDVGAVGVDIDAEACRQAADSGAEVIQANIFEHLKRVEPGTYDGVFMSHFVEHISYEAIQELFDLCRHALADDGVIVVVMPSVSSIGMHLDWFYRDPTHAGWRHPRTLAFFLAQAGLAIEKTGSNPNTPTPYLGEPLGKMKSLETILTNNQADLATIERQMAESAGGNQGALRRAVSFLTGRRGIDKQLAIVRQGYVDRLRNVNESLLQMSAAIEDLIGRLDASFEDYVVARKKG